MKFLDTISLRAISLFSFFVMISLSLAAWAQDLPPVTDQDFIAALIAAIGSVKGASTLAIVGIVVQLLLKFLSAPMFGQWFKNLNGGIKLLVVSFLSIVGSVITLMLGGASLGVALTSGGVLTALMVFLNQVYQQFFVKKA